MLWAVRVVGLWVAVVEQLVTAPKVLATTDARRVRSIESTMSAPPLPCARLSVSTPLELLDPPCLKYAVSKTLGYGIVVGST